jgi:hypothetical protein
MISKVKRAGGVALSTCSKSRLDTMAAFMIRMYPASVIVLVGSEFNAANERKRRGGRY